MQRSILIDVDSYKVSMWKQYPPGTDYIYSYIESRGGVYDKTLFFGLQAFIRDRLKKPITQEEIDLADRFWTAHGEPFNRAGWEHILKKHGGVLPVEVSSLDEGGVYPTGTVLATIVNTDPECFWLTTWLETSMLRYVWYCTTVATQSYEIKKVIYDYLLKSGDPESILFKCHDFGLRGVSSLESGMLGGMSHLVNFRGSDTAIAAFAACEFYDADVMNTTWSIPAAEHSTITSWGQENEALAYENMVNQFSKPGSVYAVVSDSYDIFNAVDKIWGKELIDKVKSSGGTLVIRPDSGDPIEVLPKIFGSLYKNFGGVKNNKGYIVLNNVRLIWGDGINLFTIYSILRFVVDYMGFSADNIAFGMGGALLQMVNRDTQKFAMKCSAAYVDGKWVDVFKDPVTDKGKRSKRGRFDGMVTRYVDGSLHAQQTFEEVQKLSEKYLTT